MNEPIYYLYYTGFGTVIWYHSFWEVVNYYYQLCYKKRDNLDTPHYVYFITKLYKYDNKNTRETHGGKSKQMQVVFVRVLSF